MRKGLKDRDVKEEKLTVISDSSVIIALAKICHIDLLEKLFQQVIVPEAVWRETAVEGKPGSSKILNASFIRIERPHSRGLASILQEFVDTGEAESIALAIEIKADLLLLDDHDARTLAKRLGLDFIGTLGLIALAKHRGLIPEVKPLVNELIEKGFWISRKMLERFLRELGEL